MRRLAFLATLSCCTPAAASPYHWTVAKNSRFEVYSQTGDATAQKALIWFEQLRTFFRQNGLLGASLDDQDRRALRVIGFRSEKEYEEYRLRPIADAYYVSDGSRDYIVMAGLQAKEFGTAAHEYAHYVLRTSGLKLPAWLNEGLAEFFSTLRLNEGGYELGGDLPARRQTLRRNTRLPLAKLLDFANESPMPNTRRGVEIFYAESWVLVDMLITSPQYAAHFRELISEFGAGSNAMQAFRKVYNKSLDEVAKGLENWVVQPRSTRFLPSRPAEFAAAQGHGSELSARQTSNLLAQLSLVSGHLEQARTRYGELLREGPDDPDFRAALGTIALRQGNREEALKQWRRALSDEITDANLCYRYALLAEEAGWGAQDVKAALERAVALAPGFDDARYKLALIQNQRGKYRSAVEQLRAMRVPVGARRYAYWIAIASALIELNERGQAKEAAEEAAKAAQTDTDRLQARQMGYIAATDLTVQFATDSEGHSQLVTTRVQHGTTDWNPFIEPSDHIERASGKLGEVLCTADKLTGFLLRTSDGSVTVEVPDPSHVLMHNSPNEFFCGRMREKSVVAEYAVVESAGKTKNVLRGMTFQ
jgi:tetratricopeptide (TPR) repeat protein